MRFLAVFFCSLVLSACGGGGNLPVATITAIPQPVRAASVLTGGTKVAVHVYQALNGQAPSNGQLSTFLIQIGAGDGFAWANFMASSFNNLSDSALSTLVLNNINITPTSLTATATFGTSLQAYTALQGALADYFRWVGIGNRGIVIVQLAEIISNLEVDTQFGVYGGAATTFNKRIAANHTYSSNTANVVAAAVPLSTANAGSAQTVVVGQQVVLDGTSSSSVAGAIVSYAWTLTTRPVGSAATLSSLTSGKPTFTPDIPGTYVATLMVHDGVSNSNPATVSILANAAPPAIALNQTEPVGSKVTLSLDNGLAYSTVSWYSDLSLIGTGVGVGNPVTWDTLSVSNGTHLILARVQVAPGSYVEVRRTVTVFNIGITFGANVSGKISPIYVDVGASAKNGVALVSATLDGVSVGSLSEPNKCSCFTCCNTGMATYSYDMFRFTVTAVSGDRTMTFTIMDKAGFSETFTLPVPVANLPVLNVTSPVDGSAVSGTLNVGGTCTTDRVGGVTVTAALSGYPFMSTTSTNFNGSMNLVGLKPANYSLLVQCTDSANTLAWLQRTLKVN